MRFVRKELVMLCGLLSLILFASVVILSISQFVCAEMSAETEAENKPRNFSHSSAMCVPPDNGGEAADEFIGPAVSYVRHCRTDGMMSCAFSGTTEFRILGEVVLGKIKKLFCEITHSGIVMIC